MDNEILFTERQKFKQWWLWLLLIGINGLFLYGLIIQVIFGQQFGTKPMTNTGIIITSGLLLLLTILFLIFRLDTIIKRDGVYVRFFPFHLSFRHYTWEKINKIYYNTR